MIYCLFFYAAVLIYWAIAIPSRVWTLPVYTIKLLWERKGFTLFLKKGIDLDASFGYRIYFLFLIIVNLGSCSSFKSWFWMFWCIFQVVKEAVLWNGLSSLYGDDCKLNNVLPVYKLIFLFITYLLLLEIIFVYLKLLCIILL